MRTYLLKVKHDKGNKRIFTCARNKDEAIQTIMDYEGCPRRAIISCERYTERILV